MNLAEILGWLAIGAFVGWIPSVVMRVHGAVNVLLDIAAGMGGAAIGGVLVGGLERLVESQGSAFSVGGLLAAFGCSLIATALSGRGRWSNNEITRRHRRQNTYLYN